MKIRNLITLSLIIVFFVQCQQNNENSTTENKATVLKDYYLGQKTPGMKPIVFMPNIISSKDNFEFSNCFSPDGKEFYFARRVEGSDIILKASLDNSENSIKIDTMSFFSELNGFEPHISHDNKLYFTRFAPPPVEFEKNDNISRREKEARMVNIWMSEKKRTMNGANQHFV